LFIGLLCAVIVSNVTVLQRVNKRLLETKPLCWRLTTAIWSANNAKSRRSARCTIFFCWIEVNRSASSGSPQVIVAIVQWDCR